MPSVAILCRLTCKSRMSELSQACCKEQALSLPCLENLLAHHTQAAQSHLHAPAHIDSSMQHLITMRAHAPTQQSCQTLESADGLFLVHISQVMWCMHLQASWASWPCSRVQPALRRGPTLGTLGLQRPLLRQLPASLLPSLVQRRLVLVAELAGASICAVHETSRDPGFSALHVWNQLWAAAS